MGLQCIPLSSMWTGSARQCINIGTLVTVMAFVRPLPSQSIKRLGKFFAEFHVSVLQVLTDFIILFLPTPYLWRLKVSREVKLGLFCTFALGGW